MKRNFRCKNFKFLHMPSAAQWIWSSFHHIVISLIKSLWDLLSIPLPLILWKSASKKIKWCPKSKVKINMLNLSNKVKIWDFLRGTWAEVGGGCVMEKMNQASTVKCWTLCIQSICGFSSTQSPWDYWYQRSA
jgi:hypothetical protein